MKGLFYKELYTLSSYKKTIVVFFLIFIFVAFLNKAYVMLPIMMALPAMMATVATFSYDELARWDRFALTLPIGRHDLVRGKYYFFLVLVLGCLLFGFLLTMVFQVVMNGAIQWEDLVGSLVGAIIGVIGCTCIQIPLIYRYGVEKARIGLFVLVGFFGILLFGVISLFRYFHIHLFELFYQLTWSTMTVVVVVFAALFLLMLALFVSYRVSCHFFDKREL